MAGRQNPPYPTARSLRLFCWIVAAGLALSGNLVGPSPAALWLELAGAAIFAIGTVRPSSLRPIYTFLMFALRPITRLVSWFAKSSNDRRPPIPPARRGQVANTGA
jgi:hypothetical protein